MPMWPFRRKKKRTVESVGTQLTILRTHMAGQAGDLSTMRLQLGLLADRLAELDKNFDNRIGAVHREVTRIGLYHPGAVITKAANQ